MAAPTPPASPRFSEFYSLKKTQADLEFVDVLLETDLPLYVDPYAFKIGKDTRSIICNDLVVDFFENVIEAIRAGKGFRSIILLRNLREPNSTRLGLSQGMPRGRGVGRDKASDLHERLTKSRAAKTGILRDLSDCELLIPGIGNDNISDITVNVIRSELIKFTKEQCDRWGIPTQRVQSGPAWSEEQKNWINAYGDLPVYRGRQVILVPKEFVRYHLAADHQEYYNHFVLDYLQQENLNGNTSLVKVLKNGKRVVRKKDLREQHPCNKDWLLDFSEAHPDVWKEYKDHASQKQLKINDISLEAFIRKYQQGPNPVNINVQPGGTLNMQNNTVQGDNIGGTVGGGTVNARDITVYKNSVEASTLEPELKAVLVKAREELEREKVTEADRNDVADSLGKLTEEMAKKEKDPGLVRRWVGRIRDIIPSIANVLTGAKIIHDLMQGQPPTTPPTP